MTERKPEGVSWQSWIERQISEGQAGGAFDGLPGHGRPIDDIGPVRDELWWVKAKLRSEDLEFLPPTIKIRAERAAAIDEAMHAQNEHLALVIVEDVNVRIRHINSRGAVGPPSTTVAIDVGAFLERWHEAHPPALDDQCDADRCDVPVADITGRWRRLVSRMRRVVGRS